jgi:uncharacterized protein YndB with AHSA1/START domain
MLVDVNRDALVVVEHSTLIDAPLEKVWRLQSTIDEWSSWQPEIGRARLDGPLAPGSSFHWESHGLDITSTIRQVVPGERIVWGGSAPDIEAVHVWALEPGADGVTVRTVESWDGPEVTADPDGLRTALSASLVAWLAALGKAAREAR